MKKWCILFSLITMLVAASCHLEVAEELPEPMRTDNGVEEIRPVFERDISAFVILTARPPDNMSREELDTIYERWKDTARDRLGTIASYMFQFEPDGQSQPLYMFSLVFLGNPDGMDAAYRHRTEEYARFRSILEDAAFNEISLQSNLLYVNGDNCSGQQNEGSGSSGGHPPLCNGQ